MRSAYGAPVSTRMRVFRMEGRYEYEAWLATQTYGNFQSDATVSPTTEYPSRTSQDAPLGVLRGIRLAHVHKLGIEVEIVISVEQRAPVLCTGVCQHSFKSSHLCTTCSDRSALLAHGELSTRRSTDRHFEGFAIALTCYSIAPTMPNARCFGLRPPAGLSCD